MKLLKLPTDVQYNEDRLKDLEFLLEQPTYKALRPCPGCHKLCPCRAASAICTCMCGPDCEQANSVMSSEGENYPIDEKIVTLVFGLNCLRVCTPYWSCEGHRFGNGELHRVPQVWFYSRSMIYPKMMGEIVTQMKFKKKIRNPWHVCISYAEESLETGFSIEPDTKSIDKPNLESMQNDARCISDLLVPEMRHLAKKYIAQYQHSTSRV